MTAKDRELGVELRQGGPDALKSLAPLKLCVKSGEGSFAWASASGLRPAISFGLAPVQTSGAIQRGFSGFGRTRAARGEICVSQAAVIARRRESG